MNNIWTPSPSTILFIDALYVKQNSVLNQNVDDNLLISNIQAAQDMFLMPILGSGLFGQIRQQASANTLTVTTLYMLTTFMQPILCNSTLMELLPFLNFQLKNKSVVKQHSEFSEPASAEEINILVEKYRSRAAFYAQRFTNWLLDNLSNPELNNYLNPQLYTTSCGIDLYYPNSSSYGSNGIYLDGLDGNTDSYLKGGGFDQNDWINLRNNI